MKVDFSFILIDGNVCTKNVVGYCTRYKGFLTWGLCETHSCKNKNCNKFKDIKDCLNVLNKQFSNNVIIKG